MFPSHLTVGVWGAGDTGSVRVAQVSPAVRVAGAQEAARALWLKLIIDKKNQESKANENRRKLHVQKDGPVEKLIK